MIKSMTKGLDYRFPYMPPPQPPSTDKDAISCEVQFFINRFTIDFEGNNRKEVEFAFTHGCCYWFAYILKARFDGEYDCEIMADYTINHFGTRVEDRVYDITGDVTDTYNWESWYQCDDDELRDRVADCCILF